METSIHKSNLPTLLLKRVFDMALIYIYKSGQLLFKCSYWFLGLFMFISCQRTLTLESTQNHHVLNISPSAEQFVTIDTSSYVISNRLSVVTQTYPHLSEKLHDKIIRFYQTNSLKTKWLETDKPHPLYHGLMEVLEHASEHGLNTDDYPVKEIDESVRLLYRSTHIDEHALIDLDVHITETFFLLTTHLKEGRIINPGYGRNIWLREAKVDNHTDVTLLAQAKNNSQLQEVIKTLQPQHEQYARLKVALEHYRSLEKISLPLIQANKKIKPEDSHVSIPTIRKKLKHMDFLMTDPGDSAHINDTLFYDHGLVLAVKEFQERHGLASDGIIGSETIKSLNRSFRETADRIALSMERLRWLPDHYGDHYITVNIPEYKLRIIENGQPTLEMKVIVGALTSPTPIFRDTLEYIVFSPTWTVPPSVMKDEVLPRLKKNATYYDETKFSFYKNGVLINPALESWDSIQTIQAYSVVQKPGIENALGLVKFVMPNNMHIYLHDTPDHSLFTRSVRAMSHGCIRLDDPALLAYYLLQEETWDMESIYKAMYSFKPKKVLLDKQYPVRLQYNTVWVDDAGKLNFREDIYGHDERHLSQLRKNDSIPATNVLAVAATRN